MNNNIVPNGMKILMPTVMIITIVHNFLLELLKCYMSLELEY